jgi:hypothetical protein
MIKLGSLSLLLVVMNLNDFSLVIIFVVGYLTTLTISRLYGVDGRMFNEYGTFAGMRIGGEKWKC